MHLAQDAIARRPAAARPQVARTVLQVVVFALQVLGEPLERVAIPADTGTLEVTDLAHLQEILTTEVLENVAVADAIADQYAQPVPYLTLVLEEGAGDASGRGDPFKGVQPSAWEIHWSVGRRGKMSV